MSRQEILDAIGAPVVVFDKVSLAFDEKVILARRQLHADQGAHEDHPRRKRCREVDDPEADHWACCGRTPASIWVNGERVDQMNELELMRVRADLGMVFQEGALFDSLTVRENVGYKLWEELRWPDDQVNARVEEILGFIGLSEHVDKMPSELSGGQRRRVAIARAMAAKPRVLLYDEPTTGLDPITATTVDEEIVKLRDLEGVSSIVVTHQLRDAFYIAGHTATRNGGRRRSWSADEEKSEEAEFIMLRDGGIAFEGPAGELKRSTDPYLLHFLS